MWYEDPEELGWSRFASTPNFSPVPDVFTSKHDRARARRVASQSLRAHSCTLFGADNLCILQSAFNYIYS